MLGFASHVIYTASRAAHEAVGYNTQASGETRVARMVSRCLCQIYNHPLCTEAIKAEPNQTPSPAQVSAPVRTVYLPTGTASVDTLCKQF